MILILEKDMRNRYIVYNAESEELCGEGRTPSSALMDVAADAREFPGMYLDASEGQDVVAAAKKVIKALRPLRTKPTKRR